MEGEARAVGVATRALGVAYWASVVGLSAAENVGVGRGDCEAVERGGEGVGKGVRVPVASWGVGVVARRGVLDGVAVACAASLEGEAGAEGALDWEASTEVEGEVLGASLTCAGGVAEGVLVEPPVVVASAGGDAVCFMGLGEGTPVALAVLELEMVARGEGVTPRDSEGCWDACGEVEGVEEGEGGALDAGVADADAVVLGVWARGVGEGKGGVALEEGELLADALGAEAFVAVGGRLACEDWEGEEEREGAREASEDREDDPEVVGV